MSYNGSGLFQINTSGQPVVGGTVISATVFNAFTADIATGLSTAITKDGQTTVTANIPLGGFRITGLGFGSATTDAARMDNANSTVCEFRLSLTTAVPVTTSDVTAATTLYWVPFKGNRVALYNGSSAWVMRSSAELSIAVPASTDTNYDVFVYDNSGTVAIDTLVAWTNDSTRATALVYQDGVLVKSGATTRRYVGTFRTTGVSGQTEDSYLKRFCWNYYNQVPRNMLYQPPDSTPSWTHTTTTWIRANGVAGAQVAFVLGVAGFRFDASAIGAASTTNTSNQPIIGIGWDQARPDPGALVSFCGGHASGVIVPLSSAFKIYPAVGYHFATFSDVDGAAAGGTTTFYSRSSGPGGNTFASGIQGEILG